MQLLLFSAVVLQMQGIVYSKLLAACTGKLGSETVPWTASLIARATVVERLVKTTIEETVCNRETRSLEAVLTLVVQSDAYITGFSARSYVTLQTFGESPGS